MKEYVFKPRGLSSPRKETPNGNYIKHQCSGIVSSVKDGEEIIEILKRLVPNNAENKACFVTGNDPAYLDYKENEPNWIQLKICACTEKLESLDVLYVLCSEKNVISEDIIKICLNEKLVELVAEEYYKCLRITRTLERQGKSVDYKALRSDMYVEIDKVLDENYYNVPIETNINSKKVED